MWGPGCSAWRFDKTMPWELRGTKSTKGDPVSYHFYLFLHLVSLFVVLLTLGGISFHMISGGTKFNFTIRKQVAIIHGIAVLVAFVSGFGLIAKANYSFSTSQWLVGKIICWLIIGAFPTIAYKKVLPRWGDFLLLCLVAAAAVSLVVFKPF